MCIHVSKNLWSKHHGSDLCLARTSVPEVRLQGCSDPTVESDHYHVHMKAIKSDRNQILHYCFVCVYMQEHWLGQLTMSHTDKHTQKM